MSSNEYSRNSALYRRIKDRAARCELCGGWRNIEVHHIIPLVYGGTNDEENLIAICEVCHYKLTPKSILIEAGKRKKRAKGVRVDGRPPKFSDEEIDKAMKLLDDGNSYNFVERTTGISKSTLVRKRKQRKIIHNQY